MPPRGALRLRYAASANGAPDAGEIVWGWVPFQEDPRQGKDRPLLVLAPAGAGSVFAMKLTSRAPERAEGHLPLGSGEWDRERRPSWVDTDQLYEVPCESVRREGAALDRARFDTVARALADRHGWTVTG